MNSRAVIPKSWETEKQEEQEEGRQRKKKQRVNDNGKATREEREDCRLNDEETREKAKLTMTLRTI